jgi:predicted methyltransferase
MFSRATTVEFAAAIAVCFNINIAGAATQNSPDYAALIAAPDRSAADRSTDARRDPLQILTFVGARPGMKVLDMGAGGGYSTGLMARAVGPNGVVYGQNAPDFGAPGKAAFEARETTPAGKQMVGLSTRLTIRCPRMCATSILSLFCSSITRRPTCRSIVPR